MTRNITYQARDSMWRKFTVVYGSQFLIFGVSALVLVGCEIDRAENQLERLKTSYLAPQTYTVAHEEIPIGTYWRVGIETDDSAYEFRTKLNMPSANGLTLSTETVYQFESQPPFPLSNVMRTTYAATMGFPGQEEVIYPSVAHNVNQRSNMLSANPYNLRDFFGLELAMMEQSISVKGDVLNMVAPVLDLSQSLTWQVSSRNRRRMTLENTEGDSVIYKFTGGLPQLEELRDSDGLVIKKIPFEDFNSIDLQPLHVIEDVHIPVYPAIENPRTVSALVVQFEFADDEVGPWESVLDEDFVFNTATKLPTPASRFHDSPRTPFDAQTHRKLRATLADISKSIDDAQSLIDAIVAYVHQTISYKRWNKLQSIDETLLQKKGDCTEFAQLFTALASSADLSSRTVVGIAYHEPSQTFGIHAWNEVKFGDGSIRVVDPTWNQAHADAARIEFPPAYQHEILRTLEKLRIRVLSTSHEL